MNADSHRLRRAIAAALVVCALALAGCHRADEAGSFPAANHNDCLPDVTLVDQHGNRVSLASLKGEPVLVDFIYTTCGGTCPMLTAKMAAAGKLLGPALGKRIRIVSITIDPEHDDPAVLLEYARTHDADRPGWLFLTGKPEQIERVLAAYNLKRYRGADGSIDHVTASFLLGPDGRQIRQYDGVAVKAETLAADADQVLSRG